MLLPVEQPFSQLILIGIAVFIISHLIVTIYASLGEQKVLQSSYLEQINQCLPQTQCGKCSYEGCRPYAEAIAEGEAINKCPPGGNQTIIKLSNLMNEPLTALNPAHGSCTATRIAVIREDECIGCTKCIIACPVDAIIGSSKLMHTVIENECTGCDLCVDPCPVDCIDMLETENTLSKWTLPMHTGPISQLLVAK